ncbi:uncharacterized protein [Apostichopus japonicus]|uniref:uncharacterized protein n=1 Tax=Stichopus japonicus TaxID=307972 RepID=UPI003AB27AF6
MAPNTCLKLMVTFMIVMSTYVHACQPPDCERVDCGSCGNACCLTEFQFASSSSETIYNTFVTSLKAGGADGRYTFIGGSDLRKYNVSADFILQGWHTTLEHHYNDTLDFTFSVASSKETVVRAFSISQIAGAYCDAGQNYKNLVGLIKGLKEDFKEEAVLGCPVP